MKDLPKDLSKEVPKIRSGSYTQAATKKFVKAPKRKLSVGIQPRIEIRVIKPKKGNDVKLPKIEDFKQKCKNLIETG